MAIVIEASNAYARGLLTGILRHVREHEPWTVFLPEHGRGTPPLEAIAMRTGFKHTEYMTVAFTKRHGMPPSRWRKQRR